MSFILDALKRAEQERNLGQTPTLNSAYAVPTEVKENALWRWLVPLLIVNAVVLAYIGVRWLNQPSPLTTAVETQVPAVADVPPEPAITQSDNISIPPIAPEQSEQGPSVVALVSEPDPLPLRLLPTEYRRSLPTLTIDIHVYSDVPQRRFVLINAKRYQQGEWLDEGPLLESITIDGVVLSYQGQRFKLAVQSSLSRSKAAEFIQ